MMQPVARETVERQLEWRYATKLFDPERIISDDDWITLERTLVLTPSSFGLQPWRFIVVTDPQFKAQLRTASWNQAQLVDASHIVVFAIKQNFGPTEIDKHLARMSEVSGSPVESLSRLRQIMVDSLQSPPFDIDNWAARQVYIALGFFMSAAAMMGIDTCPIEGFEPQKYNSILGLSEMGYCASVVAAAGYRSASDKYATFPKVRFKAEDVITRISG